MTEPGMENQPPPTPEAAVAAAPRRAGRSVLFYALIAASVVIGLMVMTAVGTVWWVKRHIDPPPITAVELTQLEEKVLEEKLVTLGDGTAGGGNTQLEVETVDEPLQLEKRGSVTITERELNGLIAHNTGLGDKVELQLRNHTVRALTNFPVPDDFPILGGRVLRFDVALRTELVDDKLVLRVADISLGGFPLPNAWLGGVKGKNLMEEFGNSGPLRAFAAGIRELTIDNGELTLIPAD